MTEDEKREYEKKPTSVYVECADICNSDIYMF